MDVLEEILKCIKFKYDNGKRGSKRKISANGKVPKVLLFGKTRKIPQGSNRDLTKKAKIEISESACDREFPELKEMLDKLAKDLFPELKYTHIQINKNFQTLMHLDKGNEGLSAIFTLGDFTGGQLKVEDSTYDIYKNPFFFDGSKQMHGTMPFTGERYCVIYYCNPKLSK